jgi:hypothetical protein
LIRNICMVFDIYLRKQTQQRFSKVIWFNTAKERRGSQRSRKVTQSLFVTQSQLKKMLSFLWKRGGE